MKNKFIRALELKGEVTPPPSKSILHRYIIAASLAKGKSIIRNINFSDDINATIEAMKILGANVEIKNENNSPYLEINGSKTFFDDFLNKNSIINCNESGSTLRFLIPLSLVKKNKIYFVGQGKLFKRPLDSYFKNFDKYGIKYSYENENKVLFDGNLKAGIYEIDGNISSQFITGLLFSLPLLNGNSKIIINGKLESSSYVDMTLECLEKFGIKVENKNYSEFIIDGNQEYKATDCTVEADFSQAAFFIVANSLGAEIDIKGLNYDSLQGDKKIIDFIKLIDETEYEQELIIDGSETPDIIPILALKAAVSEKMVRIANVGRLRIKESDRLSATVQELTKIHLDIQEKDDDILINFKFNGNRRLKALFGDEFDIKWFPKKMSSHDDHRIAMMLAIASFWYQGNLILDNLDCVKKSYPDFWDVFINLGGIINNE